MAPRGKAGAKAPPPVVDETKPYPDTGPLAVAARVTLIGFSGGGTLAMLLAPGLPRVTRVITVAANLDTAAWTAHHGYPPLTASLNPATRPPLGPRIAQTHYLGERDSSVPPSLLAALRTRTADADWRVVPGFDHQCCWVERWPVLLDAAIAGEAR